MHREPAAPCPACVADPRSAAAGLLAFAPAEGDGGRETDAEPGYGAGSGGGHIHVHVIQPKRTVGGLLNGAIKG
ncbi:hypothetical protein KNE206_24160 [Kitasatospora sp. NE20-6]